MDSLSVEVEEEGDSTKGSKYSLVNFLPSDTEDDEDETYQITLLPERPRKAPTFRAPAFKVTKTSSPSPSPTKGLTLGSHYFDFLPKSENDNKGTKRRSSMSAELMGDVSPSRVALSTIQDFVETTIVLRKDKDSEMGISVMGGSDTYLESVCVTEVHPQGAAHKDGRLRVGDIILAVNDISFRDIPWRDSVRVLREAPSPLKLLVLRENPQTLFTTIQSPTKFITVELRKTSIKDKLGLSFVQRTNGRGVFITYVQPGSIASQHGTQVRIMQGDQMLEINGQNVRDSNQKDIAFILNNLDGAIVLLLGRVLSLSNAIQEWCRKKSRVNWRARTSTWSAYSANNKDKVQNQRPSLPVSQDTTYFAETSPDREIEPGSPFAPFAPFFGTGFEIEEGMVSRSSSIRSRARLSVVVEDNKGNRQDSLESEPEMTTLRPGTEIALLPSIQVTEF